MQQQTLGLEYRFAFTVPGPPQAKQRPRLKRTRSGKQIAYTPQRTHDYESKVAAVAQRARPDDWFEHPAPAGYTLFARFYRARKAGDLDNLIKSICDGLNGVVWEDDAQVMEIHAYMTVDKADPRAEIAIQKRTN